MNAKLSEFADRLTTLQTTRQGLRATLSIKSTPDKDDADLLHMVASNETLDRYDEVIEADGWQLDRYRKNPVIQNSHRYSDILDTIGRAEKTEVVNGALVQVWRFATKENPIAKIARDLYRGRFLNASSVGFIPHEWENGSEKAGYRRRYTKSELLEVSAVGIPANPDALQLAYKSGCIEKSDLVELSKLLTGTLKQISREAGAPAPRAKMRNPYTGEEMDGMCGSLEAYQRWEKDHAAAEAEEAQIVAAVSKLAHTVGRTLKHV